MSGQHVVSLKTYLLVWLALLILLLITWGSAYLSLGPFNFVINILVAIGKAFLVLVFFMHVKYARPPTRIFVAAGFFWLFILFGLTLSDYATRADRVLTYVYPVVSTQEKPGQPP